MALRKRAEHTIDITRDPATGGQKIWLDGAELENVSNLVLEWHPKPPYKITAEITLLVFVDKLSSEGVEVKMDTEEVVPTNYSDPPSEIVVQGKEDVARFMQDNVKNGPLSDNEGT